MGLDIAAYSHMTRTECLEMFSDYCYESGHVPAYAYSDFPRSYAGLGNADQVFDMNGSEFIGGACYVATDHTMTCDFQAGSYSGYSTYRDFLAETFLGMSRKTLGDEFWEKLQEMPVGTPFYELINFADNEGAIGPIAAAKLYYDHVDNKEQFEEALAGWRPWERDRFLEKYSNWTRAFSYARQGGLVRFH